jgi:Holliday junction resolvase RusA-like endonuclease
MDHNEGPPDVYVYTFRAEVSSIFSENFYLKPGRSKKGSLYMYLHPEAKRYKEKLIKQFTEQMKENGFPYGKVFPFKVVYNFYVLTERDVTNMIKVTEDAFSEAIGVDDSVWDTVLANRILIGKNTNGVPEGKELVIIEAYCYNHQ